MPETLKIILVFLMIITLLILARKIRVSQMIKVRDRIINDLKSKGALDEKSAIELKQSQRWYHRIGTRDDRPKTLKQLVQFGIVSVTENQLFYLNESEIASQVKE